MDLWSAWAARRKLWCDVMEFLTPLSWTELKGLQLCTSMDSCSSVPEFGGYFSRASSVGAMRRICVPGCSWLQLFASPYSNQFANLLASSLHLHSELFVYCQGMVLIYAELQDYPKRWLLHQVLGAPKHRVRLMEPQTRTGRHKGLCSPQHSCPQTKLIWCLEVLVGRQTPHSALHW